MIRENTKIGHFHDLMELGSLDYHVISDLYKILFESDGYVIESYYDSSNPNLSNVDLYRLHHVDFPNSAILIHWYELSERIILPLLAKALGFESVLELSLSRNKPEDFSLYIDWLSDLLKELKILLTA